ncbi:branched-chain amino acid ABC transporter permease [Salarchaeum sp. JOR-1]|uniref:branched-chain amino acid ABC transporter permease n=1 Tax=Salarchaeum sp. JOR-1 TaxID=2599399 RepID=UPI001198711C|nr:branched-chain amino acid ABC transporter permease [Salarchaeum sp. JOR-1]QDX40967.1 branched-chain amino acid ABC transporter permease [Salarchaeum sp. JOR-1]
MALPLIDVVANAVMMSALYALVAIGFTLIFGVGGVLNLAHGATVTIGAFSAYYASEVFGFSIWVGALAAILVPGLFSAALYKGMIQRVEDDPITVMILTLVTAIAVEEIIKQGFGTQPAVISSLLTGQVSIAGGIQANSLLVFALSWVIIGLLFFAINYTKTGKAILATSMSTKGASLVGIESDRMYLYTWVLAGAFAGLAGLFLGSIQTASWSMGRAPLVLSFSIVVLGGIGSIRGSVIGAYIIGFLETFTMSYVDSSLSGLASLVVLVLILLAKPEGLFGREFTE